MLSTWLIHLGHIHNFILLVGRTTTSLYPVTADKVLSCNILLQIRIMTEELCNKAVQHDFGSQSHVLEQLLPTALTQL